MLGTEVTALNNRLLAQTPVSTPTVQAHAKHVYPVYVIRGYQRDRLQRSVQAAGIHTAIHYPISVQMQPAYAYLGYGGGDFSESELAAAEELPLPMFGELQSGQIHQILGSAAHHFDLVGAP